VPADPAAPSFFENLRASGKVNVGHLRIHGVVADRVSAWLELEHGRMTVSDLRADLLGGKHRGNGQADFTAASPVYSASGTVTGISLEKLAGAMDDAWISGTGGGTYQFKASGTDSATFWRSAEGELRFDLRDGALPHISLGSDEGPLRIARWQGRARLNHGSIDIQKGEFDSPTGAYEISGTASLGEELDFEVVTGTQLNAAGAMVYSITGTVAEPRVTVTPAPETQAQLKP
jgi:AsmA protein